MSHLVGIPNKLIVDTNVLLHACFIRAQSFHCLVLLKNYCDLIITKDILIEGLDTLSKIENKFNLNFSPSNHFKDFTKNFNIQNIRLNTSPVIFVNNRDQHIANASKYFSCPILTDDMPLMSQLDKEKISWYQPWRIILDEKIRRNDNSLDDIVMVNGFSFQNGYIFIKFEPGEWRASQKEVISYFFEIKDTLKLYYDNLSKKIKLEVKNETINFDLDLLDQGYWDICVSFLSESTRTKVHLSALNLHYKTHIRTTKYTSLLSNTNFSIVSSKICSDFGEKHSLWGWLRLFITSDKNISFKKWKNLSLNHDFAPNPYDSGNLEQAIKDISNKLFCFRNPART